jgi:CHAT domain-containing protein
VFGEASAEAPKAAAQVPHPLLRSGLALAAANRPPSPLGDGLLTALEAADLDLRGTQLVVLSACQTALGDAEPGLGVAGLTSAVQAAGAQSTVLSLWQVDDDATRALMQLFYRGLLAGTSRAQALRQAQAAIAAQSKWRHPFYWAAFVLNGADGPVRIL